VARDKANLDLIWLKDDSLEDSDKLPPPEIIAREIVEDLQAALAELPLWLTHSRRLPDRQVQT
jgi:type I restriction enzyme M protein